MDVKSKNSLLEYLPNTVENLRKMYNLDGGRIEQSVDILEEWLKKQKHFLNKNYSRQYLESTIIACKGSVEKAKMQIENLCTFRNVMSKFFVGSGVKTVCDDLSEFAQAVVLPKMTNNYERVFVLKMNDKEISSSLYFNYYRHTFIIGEYLKAHDYNNGYIIVDDLRDLNLVDFLTKFNFAEFQQFMAILTEGFGARLKGIHLITPSKTIDIFVKVIKSLLSEKIAGRIHVHGEIEDIYRIIDKDILPVDFGGTERSLKDLEANWTELLSSEENEKYLGVMKDSGTDESLRQKDSFNKHCMGLPGSFRTLIVD